MILARRMWHPQPDWHVDRVLSTSRHVTPFHVDPLPIQVTTATIECYINDSLVSNVLLLAASSKLAGHKARCPLHFGLQSIP